jgi:hypothetical protein
VFYGTAKVRLVHENIAFCFLDIIIGIGEYILEFGYFVTDGGPDYVLIPLRAHARINSRVILCVLVYNVYLIRIYRYDVFGFVIISN